MTYTAFLTSLFVSAFISSTLLPGGSEAVAVYGLTQWPQHIWSIILVATAGNTLGAVVTYLIGRIIPNKVDEKKISFFRKWGPLSLLFSWVPVVGDGFVLAAGWLRVNWILSFVLILIGKFLRYFFLVFGVNILL